MNINAIVKVNERTKTYYRKSFEVLDALPEIGDILQHEKVIAIDSVTIDIENRGSCWDYDFFELTTRDLDFIDDSDADNIVYVCINHNDNELYQEVETGKIYSFTEIGEMFETLRDELPEYEDLDEFISDKLWIGELVRI